jgi:adenylate cyclase class IV
MHSYEVEIKSLLGSSERADEVRRAMKKLDPECELESKNKQLNHYFKNGTLPKLLEIAGPQLPASAHEKLADMAKKAREFSVRTRDKDGTVFLVVKASMGDDTSANGIARMEFEEEVPLTLEKLDALVLSAGFEYEAKWSREREEYKCKAVNVTLDKNAGYGWLAEFERVVDDESKLSDAEEQVRALMAELEVQELPQDRLGRMFAFYNNHWPEYYGTEKIFTIE